MKIKQLQDKAKMAINRLIYLSIGFGSTIFSLLANAAESTEECVPLETVFAQGLIEDNINGITIGGYNTTGALDIWSDNPVTEGSLEGGTKGMSSGRCSLLPGAMYWMCYGVLKLMGGDTITYVGISPNGLGKGKLTVIGGSGCYEEATGALFLTAQDEDYTSYLWEYDADSGGGESCVALDELVGDGLKEMSTGSELVGDGTTPGSFYLWNNTLINSNNDPIGQSFGECTLLPGAETWVCLGQFVLDSGDTIATVGRFPKSGLGTLVVPGGTGCYSGASTTLTIAPTSEAYESYDIKVKTPPEDGQCTKSLTEVLQGTQIYEENIGSMVVGNGTDAGDLDLWEGNILRPGSHDAETNGGTVLGQCTLLTDGVEWLCVSVFEVNDEAGSSFASLGYAPNTIDEVGSYSIVGGSDCFEGIKGEIHITALAIEEEYDFFLNEIVSTNEEDSPSATTPPTKAPTTGSTPGPSIGSTPGPTTGSTPQTTPEPNSVCPNKNIPLLYLWVISTVVIAFS